jgi:4-hydroxy-3-methylbut-2-enyl diphosphate reductase
MITTDDIKPQQYFQRGLGLKKEVEGVLQRDYHSNLVEHLRANGFKLIAGDLTIHLAQEFGFCYGVDRAVDYAYQTREKFPDRRIFLTGEIIHNPHVNKRMLDMGIRFLSGQYAEPGAYEDLRPDDVVILPAFGVSIQEFQELSRKGCVLVDTTCGSVLNVWKRVEQYARDGYTSIIHGKYYHEETIATSSQALKYPEGRYLVVRDMAEAEVAIDYILRGGDKGEFLERFRKAASPGFDPDLHLERVGLANQTTMLSSESLAIAERFRQAMIEKYGAEHLDEHFRTFDTICSATQDRQDAVLELVRSKPIDLMIIIGGYNSSNTNHLVEIATEHTTAYHIDDPSCLVSAGEIRHKPVGAHEEVTTRDWLPEGKLQVGVTAGASTPNNKIGEVIERLLFCRGIDIEEVLQERAT